MKNNKIMQAAPFEGNSTATAAGAGAEGGVVRDHDESLSEGQLESMHGGFSWNVPEEGEIMGVVKGSKKMNGKALLGDYWKGPVQKLVSFSDL